MDNAIPAGDFTTWLREMEAALDGAESDVPCGDCTACCRSSHFIHVRPDETDALAHIPAELLFPAPGATDGTVIMGYNEHGHCPMLIDDRCSIYEHRPHACRVYDCRVFSATGIEPDKPAVAEQVRRWVFSGAGVEVDAIQAATKYLIENVAELPDDVRPHDATRIAVAAIRVHRLFVTDGPSLDAVSLSLRR